MPTAPLLRRPVFIYGNNVVGGAEYMFLRRSEAARRLGLEPVIITPPGAMDAKYRAVARVLHAPRPLLAKAGAWPGLNARLVGQLAAQLGPGPWSFEATAMPGLHLASLLAERLPGSDYAFFVIGPQAAPRHRPPRLADLITAPGGGGVPCAAGIITRRSRNSRTAGAFSPSTSPAPRMSPGSWVGRVSRRPSPRGGVGVRLAAPADVRPFSSQCQPLGWNHEGLR